MTQSSDDYAGGRLAYSDLTTAEASYSTSCFRLARCRCLFIACCSRSSSLHRLSPIGRVTPVHGRRSVRLAGRDGAAVQMSRWRGGAPLTEPGRALAVLGELALAHHQGHKRSRAARSALARARGRLWRLLRCARAVTVAPSRSLGAVTRYQTLRSRSRSASLSGGCLPPLPDGPRRSARRVHSAPFSAGITAVTGYRRSHGSPETSVRLTYRQLCEVRRHQVAE